MAIGRLKTKTASKGKAVSHAKYILREDKYANQGKAKGEKLEAVGNGNLPKWAKNANQFWAMADKHERKGGKVYREQEIALPRELNEIQRKELIQEWITQELGDKFVYSYAIHNPQAMDKGEQPHCHLMYSERQLDGIERGADQFFKRYNPKNPEKGGAKKANTGFDTKYQAKEFVEGIRSRWEEMCNKHLERAGITERINMKSLERQGIDRQPINFSMEEINDPTIKASYQDSLLAERELEKAKAQLESFEKTYKPLLNAKVIDTTSLPEKSLETPNRPQNEPLVVDVRTQIRNIIQNGARDGAITSLTELKQALVERGFEVTRENSEAIRFKIPNSDQHLTLKGDMFPQKQASLEQLKANFEPEAIKQRYPQISDTTLAQVIIWKNHNLAKYATPEAQQALLKNLEKSLLDIANGKELDIPKIPDNEIQPDMAVKTAQSNHEQGKGR